MIGRKGGDAEGSADRQPGQCVGNRPVTAGRLDIAEFTVPYRRFDVLQADVVGTLGESGEERLVGNQIKTPRKPIARSCHVSNHSPAEQVRSVIARGLKAKSQISPGVLGIERQEVEAMGNAFAKLPDILLAQILIQLRLSEQHDLQQFIVLRFQVGEQADFLQRGNRHPLRFLHEDHNLSLLAVAFHQIFVQRVRYFQAARVLWYAQLHLERNGVKNFFRRHTRICQIDGFNIRRQTGLQHTAQHRFAAAHFPGHLDDAFPVRDRVDQCFQDGAAIAALEEHIRIGCDLEGGVGKSEELVVHQFPSSGPGVWCCMRLYRVVRWMPSNFAAWLRLPRVISRAAST